MLSSGRGWLRRALPAVGMIVVVTAATVAVSGAPAGADPGLPVSPPTQVGTARDWSAVAAGGFETCAIRAGGTLWCSGRGGDTLTQVGANIRWSAVTTGWGHSCALDVGGSLWCWGGFGSGQLDADATANALTPGRVGPAGGWVDVSAGDQHTCGVRTDGTLWCWGLHESGQVGNGREEPGCGIYDLVCIRPILTRNPVQVGTDTNWARVAAGGKHTCATRTDGTLWCWGDNLGGQMGNGQADCWMPGSRICPFGSGPQLTPGQVGTARDWTRVVAGSMYTCGLRADRTLWCWGDNDSGELGELTEDQQQNRGRQLTPLAITVGSTWVDVAAGRYHICGIRTDGTLWCWGDKPLAEVGPGAEIPVQIGTDTRWTRVTAADDHNCALRADGTLWCWSSTAG